MAWQSFTKVLYAVSFAWQLGFLIAVPLVLFMAAGWYLDTIIKSSPLFLVCGVVLGLVTTGYEVYHMLQPLVKQ